MFINQILGSCPRNPKIAKKNAVVKDVSLLLSINLYDVNSLQARAPDSPVIIVGTHYDLMTAEERKANLPNIQEMIKDRYIAMEYGGRVYAPRERGLPKVMAMIEVSSKTGHNVRELRHMIYNIACEIKEKGG